MHDFTLLSNKGSKVTQTLLVPPGSCRQGAPACAWTSGKILLQECVICKNVKSTNLQVMSLREARSMMSSFTTRLSEYPYTLQPSTNQAAEAVQTPDIPALQRCPHATDPFHASMLILRLLSCLIAKHLHCLPAWGCLRPYCLGTCWEQYA